MILPPDSQKSSDVATDSANIIAGLRAIVGSDPNRVFEIRVLEYQEFDWCGERSVILNGLYHGREIDTAARDILALEGSYRGVYVGLNEPRNRRFGWSRSVNRLRETRRTVADSDIGQRNGIMIDIDPVRAVGHKNDPATDTERAEAWRVAAVIIADLASRDWPAPTIVSTGNGHQVTFHTELLPADTDLVHRALVALAASHGTPTVHVDTTVGNASRIVRVPGTLNRKGTPSAERPHRVAELVQSGEPRLVSVAMIEAEAASVPPAPVQSAETFVRASSDHSTDATERRILAYLDASPGAVEGAGGRSTTFRVAAALVRGFGLSEEETFRYLTESGWNARCSPPWPTRQLEERIHAAAIGSKVARGSLLDAQYQEQPRYNLSNFDELFGTSRPPANPLNTALEAAVAGLRAELADQTDEVPTRPAEYVKPNHLVRLSLREDARTIFSGPRFSGRNDSQVCDAGCLVRCGCSTTRARIARIEEDTSNSRTAPLSANTIIGDLPDYRPCPRPFARIAESLVHENTDATFVVSCGRWSCGVCRDRKRYRIKETNVPIAYQRGTHIFTGTQSEWDAARHRLDRVISGERRIRIERESYSIRLGDDQLSGVFAVPESLCDHVPDDIPGLTRCTGEVAAQHLADAVDAVPDFDLLDDGKTKIKRFRPSRGWSKLEPTETPEQDENGTEQPEPPQWKFLPGVLATSVDGVARYLNERCQQFVEDSLVDGPRAGAIDRTIVWVAPDAATKFAIRRYLIAETAEPTEASARMLGLPWPPATPAHDSTTDTQPDETSIRRLMADWGSRA